MEFKNTKGIFLQIAETICEKILDQEYQPNDKLPSVREMAAQLGVNPNTVMRTYTELQSNEIIKNKRGIGFFVEENAYPKIKTHRKKEFFNHELPEFMNKVALLQLTKEEIAAIIENLKTTQK